MNSKLGASYSCGTSKSACAAALNCISRQVSVHACLPHHTNESAALSHCTALNSEQSSTVGTATQLVALLVDSVLHHNHHSHCTNNHTGSINGSVHGRTPVKSLLHISIIFKTWESCITRHVRYASLPSELQASGFAQALAALCHIQASM